MSRTAQDINSDERDGYVSLPRHIAIIMDGNGRWAQKRHLPRFAGHKAGVEAVREVVRVCGEKNIQALTLFADGAGTRSQEAA